MGTTSSSTVPTQTSTTSSPTVPTQTSTTSSPAALPPATALVGAGCCKPWDMILQTTSLSRHTFGECAAECASNDACNAFAISGCSSSSDEVCGGACHQYQVNSPEELFGGACFDASLNGNTFCYTVQ